MDVAALVISIVAVLLSVIVAGWAIYLQWCMYRATTEQLTAIGKENASLGERIAQSLGALHETATTTGTRIDAIVAPVVSGLLRRVGTSAENALLAGEKGSDEIEEWRVNQGVSLLAKSVSGQALLTLLHGPYSLGASNNQIVALMPKGESVSNWGLQVINAVGVLTALGLVAVDSDGKTASLTAQGREVARRLSERASQPGPSTGEEVAP